MKKNIVYFMLGAFLLLSVSCKEKKAEMTLQDNLKVLATSYIQTTLHVTNYDTIVFTSIDTLTPLGYAKVNLEMLENMHTTYDEQYYNATINADQESQNMIELYRNEVIEAEDFFKNAIENGEQYPDTLMLYMVNGYYTIEENDFPIIFFSTPNFSLHILDPFANNMLEE